MSVWGGLNKKSAHHSISFCVELLTKENRRDSFRPVPAKETGPVANRLRAIFRSGIDKDGKSEFESCCVEVAVGNSNLHKVARDAIK